MKLPQLKNISGFVNYVHVCVLGVCAHESRSEESRDVRSPEAGVDKWL